MDKNIFQAHNREARKIWRAFKKGFPSRVPVNFVFHPLNFISNPKLNIEGITFEDYFNNPQIMMDGQLKLQKWRRFNVFVDMEAGYPQRWDPLYVDFQNVYDAAYFGCEIVYPKGQVPTTLPMLQEHKEKLYELEIPDPLSGNNFVKKVVEYYQYFEEKRKNFLFEGRPVKKTLAPLAGTDGPFTVAANLRGTTQLCLDCYTDPQYVHKLLSFVTEGIIRRIKTWLNFARAKYPFEEWWFADDSIQLLSTNMYEEFVLPHHRRLIGTFCKGKAFIHLCGKVQHHLKFLHEKLDISGFELGFPTNFGMARKELGKDTLLIATLHPELLKNPKLEGIEEAVKNLCFSGVKEGGRFQLRLGLPQGAPLKNLRVVYEACKKYGEY